MRVSLRFVLVALAIVLFAPALASAKTVAIAPLTTTSGAEYQWIGIALADALALRVHHQPGLNTLTLRQVNAAMRHDLLKPEDLTDSAKAIDLGRQLGADMILVGTYQATWPDIHLAVRLIDPQAKKLVHSRTIKGGVDDLVRLEAQAAEALAIAMGAKKPKVTPGAFGTEDLRAWRLTTLALDTINWQSLAPRSADPNAKLRLPAATIKSAQAQLLQAIQQDPNYGAAWAALGVTQSLLKDNAGALKSFGKATALGQGHHPTATLGAAFLRMRQGKWGAAEKILRNAIARHPGFMHARGYLGELYTHLGRYREALKTFDQYAKAVPRQPWVLAQRGYVKSKLKDHLGAIEDSIAAVDILPDSPSLLLELASRYIDAKKLIGAEDALLHCVKKHPADPTAYVRLGYVYLLQGNDDLAVPITEKALTHADFAQRLRDRGYAHLNLARAYGRKGELQRAFDHLRKAKEVPGISFKELLTDPKLKLLRKDPRFTKLMKSR